MRLSHAGDRNLACGQRDLEYTGYDPETELNRYKRFIYFSQSFILCFVIPLIMFIFYIYIHTHTYEENVLFLNKNNNKYIRLIINHIIIATRNCHIIYL